MSDQDVSEGDATAEKVAHLRSRDLNLLIATIGVYFVALLGLGAWYAFSGNRIALAAEIVLAAICSAGWARKEQYQIHTELLATRARLRILERRVLAVGSQLADRRM